MLASDQQAQLVALIKSAGVANVLAGLAGEVRRDARLTLAAGLIKQAESAVRDARP